MITHDASGPLLLTVARARPFTEHYLAAEGYGAHGFAIQEGAGAVTIEVAGVPDDAMARVAARLREHVCVGVALEVVDRLAALAEAAAR